MPGLTALRSPRGMLGLHLHLQTLLLDIKQPLSLNPPPLLSDAPAGLCCLAAGQPSETSACKLVWKESAAAGAAHLQFPAWKLAVGGKLNNE